MDRFPLMLYCFPAAGPDIAALQDGAYGTKVVGNDVELEAALADGWFETSPAARAAGEAQAAAQAEAAAAAIAAAAADAESAARAAGEETAPPTRAELEAKATELGIKFDGRTSDKKLRDLIAATLEA